MNNKEITEFGLLVESHLDLERLGPGSDEMTLKALRFIDNLGDSPKIADIGCGTGAQTAVLAKNTTGDITGIDMIADFIERFNAGAESLSLDSRMKGMVGDALDLPFEKDSLDLIWSEGMIDSLGFEKTLTYWYDFIKTGGYVSVTSPSWLTSSRPEKIAKFWTDAGSGLYSIDSNIAAMQRAGYSFVSAFTLPESCWTEGYFNPRMAAERTLLDKYPNNPVVEAYVASMKYEVDLYLENKRDYGYVFYIGKKV